MYNAGRYRNIFFSKNKFSQKNKRPNLQNRVEKSQGKAGKYPLRNMAEFLLLIIEINALLIILIMLSKQRSMTPNATSYELIEEFNTFTYHYPINQDGVSWIDDYLFPEALDDNTPINLTIPKPMLQASLCLRHTALVNAQTPISAIFAPASTIKTANKSIFHNFQKHLKTLLKKAITLRKADLCSLPSGLRAYDLWRIFREQHNSSKRILYIIFGVEQQQNLTCLTLAAEEIPQIEKMLARFPIAQIENAQKLLRQMVTDQILRMPKEELQSLCKITRFDEFYVYFKVFMDELREGGISRRVTKVRKTRFMDSPVSTTE